MIKKYDAFYLGIFYKIRGYGYEYGKEEIFVGLYNKSRTKVKNLLTGEIFKLSNYGKIEVNNVIIFEKVIHLDVHFL